MSRERKSDLIVTSSHRLKRGWSYVWRCVLFSAFFGTLAGYISALGITRMGGDGLAGTLVPWLDRLYPYLIRSL